MAISTGAAILGAAGLSLGGSLLSSRAAGRAGDAQADAALAGVEVQREALGFNQSVYETGREDLAPYRAAGGVALDAYSDIFLPGGSRATSAREEEDSGGDDVGRYRDRVNQLERAIKTINAAPGGAAARADPSRLARYTNALVRAKSNLSDAREARTTARQAAKTERAPAGTLPEAAYSPPPAEPIDYTEFEADPGYEFRIGEGVRALDRSAAARGRLLSGGHDRELTRYGQGFASNEYGNWVNRMRADQAFDSREFNNYANRLASIAGIGQTAVANSNVLGTQVASTGGQISTNIGQGIQNAGTANASGYVGQSNALTQGLGNLAYLSQLYGGGGAANDNYGPAVDLSRLPTNQLTGTY